MKSFGTNRIQRTANLPTGAIRWQQLLEIALKNLFYKKLRTTLTVMGVIIGIGAVVFLLAFGFGLRNVVTDQVVDSNTIRTIDIETPKSQLVKLDDTTLAQIEQFPNVSNVTKVYSIPGSTDFENASIESVVYGIEQDYFSLVSLTVSAGPLPSFETGNELYVNTSYAKAIGVEDASRLVGKQLTIAYPLPEESAASGDDELGSFTGVVAGVLETGSGTELYASASYFEESGYTDANQLKAVVDDKEAVLDTQKNIEALGLLTNSPLATLEQINQVFAFLNLLFLGFGGIGLVIAVLGMFNTLTISLLERTKEIGLMITLGARRKDIKRLFMLEAVGMSLIGGVSGMLVAFLTSRVVDVVLNAFARSRGVRESFTIFSFDTTLLVGAFVFSAVLGLLVVYYPAKRASTTNPIEALRS